MEVFKPLVLQKKNDFENRQKTILSAFWESSDHPQAIAIRNTENLSCKQITRKLSIETLIEKNANSSFEEKKI